MFPSAFIPPQINSGRFLLGGKLANKQTQKRKNMNKGIGIALLVVGVALIVYGCNASDSAASSVSRAFTGSPTNKTLWLLLGGTASAIVGAVMTFRPSRKL
jgi:hypothetical protein